ncbi:hypothetical protein A9Q99_24220 [Gammaproteobacteria bacterium 45_16_T64]|nr:hypothetical protein A9Q99_24220 [Gammaproteobacteria bacterium 45_16_T64]
MQSIFPFTAIVGQEHLKIALILSVIDTKLGGLLISGPRGCGKSTAARSLSALIENTDHFVNLPLGASEDRVIGTINAQAVLQSNAVEFSPGLLHKAHNGMLYMDEVNLLPDHLVDILLDASASGINYVERDGLSHQHPAHFILIGTMNPDEGELRPQILDRFGLMVSLDGPTTLEERIKITSQRLHFDEDPNTFCNNHAADQQALKHQIEHAANIKNTIALPETIQAYIATICHEAKVDGVRADITLTRAAKAYAAFNNQTVVGTVCVDAVKELVLCHRRNSDTPPSTEGGSTRDAPNNSQNNAQNNATNDTSNSQSNATQHSGQWGTLDPQQVDITNAKDYKLSSKHPQISALKKKRKI